jgi:hypothetical protein
MELAKFFLDGNDGGISVDFDPFGCGHLSQDVGGDDMSG